MVHLYAEHLLNIRTVTIQAQLSTPSSNATNVSLSADGSTLSLTHEGESASIKLPVTLSSKAQSSATLTIPAVPSKELSFRLSVDSKQGAASGAFTNGVTPASNENVVPWTADQLSDETEIKCRGCGSVLVERGKVKQWKNLPSEGWAEMMDFWHCHKPHEPHSHDGHAEVKKGYAAGSQLALESGVAMVSALDCLLVHEDCKNIKVGAPSLFILMCTSCHLSITRSFTYKIRQYGPKEPASSRAGRQRLREGSRDTMSPRSSIVHAEANLNLAQATVGMVEAWKTKSSVSLSSREARGL